jgi:hypothetical protein
MAITLTHIRAFLAVRSTGSVHAAAEQLLVSQPSVSAAVAALAAELGWLAGQRPAAAAPARSPAGPADPECPADR